MTESDQEDEYLRDGRLLQLIELGTTIVSELDLEAVLSRVLEVGRELTGARYAALGVLSPDRSHLERFITSGMNPVQEEAIGPPPKGMGVLGHLIDHPEMLRLDDVTEHPSFYGYSRGHPEMTSFLGLPITVRGEIWGNLYLAEKEGGFDHTDEESVSILATWAAVAIANARLYEKAERRGEELEKSMRRLKATAEVASLAGRGTDLPGILQAICDRAISLVEARTLLILLFGNDGRSEIGALSGEPLRGTLDEVDTGITIVSQALAAGRATRFTGVSAGLKLGQDDADDSALVIPLGFRGRILGALVAIDHAGLDEEVLHDDDLLLGSFASTAASAIASARSIAELRLRESMSAAEQERGRWSRELHDDTLQNLGGIRLLLSSAKRGQQDEGTRELLDDAVDRVDETISSLRRLIADLRPAELDELGLGAALGSLAERFEAENRIALELNIDLAFERGDADSRLTPTLEDCIYRMTQEAMTNIAKHASASRVEVEVFESAGWIRLSVTDDGVGFDPAIHTGGLGIIGMKERAELVGGTLDISTSPGSGVRIEFRLPAEHR